MSGNEKQMIDRNEIFPNGTFFANEEDPLKSLDKLIARIWSIHTVDAVEVVRCKNCRFSAQHDQYDPMECSKWATKWGVVYTTPDGYCHKGERKDND